MQQNRTATIPSLAIISSCIAIVIALLLSAPPDSSAQQVTTGAWLTFRGDPAHTGTSALTGPPESIELKGRWRVNGENEPVSASPAVTETGIVYIGTEGGFVAAVQPEGGVGWIYQVEGPVLSSPSVDENGNVFVVTGDGYMYYISSNGELIWKSDFNTDISSSPVNSGGTAYIGTDDDALLGINLNPDLSKSFTDTRKLFPEDVTNFNFLANGKVQSSPAFSGNTVFFGGGKYVYALNPNAGGTGGGGGTTTSITGGGGSATTTIPNPIKWRYSTNSDVYSSPAVKGGKVYIGADDGYLYALSENVSSNTSNIINEGELVWKRKTGDKIRSSPAVATPATTTAPLASVIKPAQQAVTEIDRVYVGSDDGNLYAYDSSGQLKWKFPTLGPVRSSPAVDNNGDIYFGSDDGSVYALFSSGALKWRYQTLGAVRSSPAIGPNQRLYVGSNDGYLYCLGQSNKLSSKPDFNIAIANSLTTIENNDNPAIITATITSPSNDPNYLSRIAQVTMDLTPLNLLGYATPDTTLSPVPITKVAMLDDGQGQDQTARDGIFTYAFGMTTIPDAITWTQAGIYTHLLTEGPPAVGAVPIMITVEDNYSNQISKPFPLSVSLKVNESVGATPSPFEINNRISNQSLNLSITSGEPIIISVTPNQGAPTQIIPITIQGLNTNFTTNNTKVEIFNNDCPTPEIIAQALPATGTDNVVVLSDTSLTAQLEITNLTNIPIIGTWDVIATTAIGEITETRNYIDCRPCRGGDPCNPDAKCTGALNYDCSKYEFAIKKNGFTISGNPGSATTSIAAQTLPLVTDSPQNSFKFTPDLIGILQESCVITLNLSNPAGIPAYNSPWNFNSGYPGQVIVDNADGGAWNGTLLTSCSVPQTVKLITTGSNVGYLTGQVRNGFTGQGVDGASIAVLTGEGTEATGNSVQSSGGGYYMLPIAAVKDKNTVIASKDGLIDTRNDVVIIKDQETPLDFSLKLDINNCPITALVKEGNLKKFYAMRDWLLASSTEGKRWVALYYRYAREVTKIILNNPPLRKKAEAFILKAAQESGKIMKGEKTDSRLKPMLEGLINSLITKGSPELRKSLQDEKQNILNFLNGK